MALRQRDRLRSATAALILTVLAPGFLTAASAASDAAPDRLILTASGSTLNDTSGGGRGGVTWLDALTADSVLGVGGEYDSIANAHWTVGTLGSTLSGGSSNNRWTVAADGRLGAGDIGSRRFEYDVEAVAVTDTLHHFVSLRLETRQFDIYTTHGNLPKARVSVLVASHWLLAASYAHSTGGNLGTVLTSARVDHIGERINWFIGGVKGHVAPAILNLQSGATGPVPRYWEGYAGLAKTFRRTQWMVSADYLDMLAGTRQLTLTVTCTLLSSHE
jgi:hypothetical protein